MILRLEEREPRISHIAHFYFGDPGNIELALSAGPEKSADKIVIRFFDHVGGGSVLEMMSQLMFRDVKVMLSRFKKSVMTNCYGSSLHISEIKTVIKEINYHEDEYRGIQELIVTLSASPSDS